MGDIIQNAVLYCQGVILYGSSGQIAVARDVLDILSTDIPGEGPLTRDERRVLDALLCRYRAHGIPADH